MPADYYYALPFATDSRIADNMIFNTKSLLYLYFPIPFILLLFWGCGSQITAGYGKVLIVRSYSPARLCLRVLGRLALALAGIVAAQSALSALLFGRLDSLPPETALKALATYYLGLLSIAAVQFMLEVCGRHDTANMIANLVAVVGLTAGTALIPGGRAGAASMLLFPNLMFGSRNGLISMPYATASWGQSLMVLCAVPTVLVIGSVVAIKRRDIY
jgi:hypothetical protein